MKRMFWAPDLASANRARQSSVSGHSDTFSGVDVLDGEVKVFVGVVSGVEDMGEKETVSGKRWRVSIEVTN